MKVDTHRLFVVEGHILVLVVPVAELASRVNIT